MTKIKTMNPDTILVFCREDSKSDGTPGDFTLATSRVFKTFASARRYMQSIAASREPRAVKVLDLLGE